MLINSLLDLIKLKSIINRVQKTNKTGNPLDNKMGKLGKLICLKLCNWLVKICSPTSNRVKRNRWRIHQFHNHKNNTHWDANTTLEIAKLKPPVAKYTIPANSATIRNTKDQKQIGAKISEWSLTKWLILNALTVRKFNNQV